MSSYQSLLSAVLARVGIVVQHSVNIQFGVVASEDDVHAWSMAACNGQTPDMIHAFYVNVSLGTVAKNNDQSLSISL